MTKETQAAFARRLGVTRSYVNKLKDAGRLVITENSLVDVESSLASIQATQDPSKPSHVLPPANQETAAQENVDGRMSYQTARTVKEKYAALAAKLSYEQSCGQLLVAADVMAVIADAAVTLRTRFESFPDLLAPQLATLSDEQQIRVMLAEEVEILLADVSAHFGKIAKSKP
jgi:hypothetical protein